ncbi:hypothetical protein P5673_009515 [Acropora cervicornis]|uniref:Uncharacterized protein n=1 Tax=Acropora cervicornis TaxID=6130 RepID=A0AAD9QT06_ACRCE|nr:hypothetical protein P5673_009515 [Acropora cervicornis]
MACLGESHKLCVLLDRNLFFPRFATDAAEDRIGRHLVIGRISSVHLISSIFCYLSVNLKGFISTAINFSSDVCTETALNMNSNS